MSPCKKVIAMMLLLGLSACTVLGNSKNDASSALYEQQEKAAEQAYTDGNYEFAEKLFKEVLVLNPKSLIAIYRLGTLAYRKGEFEKAAAFFESVIEVNPRNSKAHFNLATIRLMQAENHFKYYVATADPKADIDKVSGLIGAIEEFASSEKKQK